MRIILIYSNAGPLPLIRDILHMIRESKNFNIHHLLCIDYLIFFTEEYYLCIYNRVFFT
jgi:hypothetical protein